MERGQAIAAAVPCSAVAATLYLNDHHYTAFGFILAAIGFVFWAVFRRKAERAQHVIPVTGLSLQHMTMSEITTGSGMIVQAGGDVTIHHPAIPAPVLNVSSVPPVATADISLSEFSKMLRDANAFKQRDLIQHYTDKTFLLSGKITRVNTGAFDLPQLTIDHDGIWASVTFPNAQPNAFSYINDETWRLTAVVSLKPTNYLSIDYGSMFFSDPSWYEISPLRVSATEVE